MIKHWEYDAGDPYYMSALGRWTDRRNPVWRFACKSSDKDDYESITNWLDECCAGGYDYVMRFNDGDPFLSVEILEEEDAMAFRFRFG